MDPVVWLLLAFLGFAMLQVALYRYFHGNSSDERSATNLGARTDTGGDTGPPSTEFVRATPAEPSAQRPPEHAMCPHCGAANERDAVYTYCHRCLEPLR